MNIGANFLELTARNQQTSGVNGVESGAQRVGGSDASKAGGVDKSQSIFTKFAEMAQNKISNFMQSNEETGVNAFGEQGAGDTFVSTTKAEDKDNNVQNKDKNGEKVNEKNKNEKAEKNQKAAQNNKAQQAGKGGNQASALADNTTEEGGVKTEEGKDAKDASGTKFGGSSKALNVGINNQEEIKEIAEALGCEADEDTVKGKLANMSADDLKKLDGDVLNLAGDIGLITESDLEKKVGVNGKMGNIAATQPMNAEKKNTNETNKEDEKMKRLAINFGGLSGATV